MTDLFYFALCCIGCYAVIRHQLASVPASEPASEPKQIKYESLCNKLDTLQELKQKLFEIENMIITIEAYQTSDLDNITISDSNNNCSILINNTSGLLSDLYKEREYIRSSISQIISEIK